MNHHLRHSCFLVILTLLAGAALADIPDPGAGVDDDEVPYGVASSWLLGRKLLEEGRTEEALQYLHFAYRAQPDVAAIAMTFQQALAEGGYFRDALDVMDSLVAASPDSQSYLLRRSSLNLQAGHRDRALEDLRAIRQAGAASPDVIAAEATLLAGAGQPDQALDVYREGLELFPTQVSRFTLGMAAILQQEGKLEQIPALVAASLESKPLDSALWLVLIRSLGSLERYTEAADAAHRADQVFLHLHEDVPDSLSVAEITAGGGPVPDTPQFFMIELADHYAQHGEVERSISLLESLEEAGRLELAPSLWLARLYLGTGRAAEGSALIERLVVERPEAARAWYLRGKVSENEGDWAGAIPDYRRAADLAAHDAEIRLGLVRALLVAGEEKGSFRGQGDAADSNRADLHRQAMVAAMIAAEGDSEGQLVLGYAFLTLHDYERAAYRFDLAGENPALRVAALTQRSVCLDRMGKTGKARTVLEILRREHPENPEVANSLGYFLAEKGQDLELAESLIQEALAAEPGNGAYLDSLGWVYFRLGRYEDALDQLIRAVNVQPEDPVILEHVALTMAELGQLAQARDLIARALMLGGDAERLQSTLDDLDRRLQAAPAR